MSRYIDASAPDSRNMLQGMADGCKADGVV